MDKRRPQPFLSWISVSSWLCSRSPATIAPRPDQASSQAVEHDELSLREQLVLTARFTKRGGARDADRPTESDSFRE